MLSLKDIKNLEKSKKARDEQGLFITEGIKLFMEAPPSDIVCVVTTARFAAEHPEAIARIPARADAVTDLREDRFAGLSDTRSPQGVLTVQRRTAFDREAVLGGKAPLILFLENLQDPGNAGTILRTAEAAGVDAVFLLEGSVDMYNPKTIRSTMGSIFRVPHFYEPDTAAFLAELKDRKIRSYAAHLGGNMDYTDPDYSVGTAFLIGNESRGLTDTAAACADTLVRIPMAGKVESLNAAMAAGILMFEAGRQRRTGR